MTDDRAIWDFVTAWVQDNIVPILRPASPPDGFNILQPLVTSMPGKEDHHMFGVVYGNQGGGGGRALSIQGFNGLTAANLPDPGPGTSQTIVNVRGVPAVLQVTPASTTPPYSGGVWLLWIEGEAINGIVPPHISRDHPQYSIHAVGLSPDEVVAIANSLLPYP